MVNKSIKPKAPFPVAAIIFLAYFVWSIIADFLEFAIATRQNEFYVPWNYEWLDIGDWINIILSFVPYIILGVVLLFRKNNIVITAMLAVLLLLSLKNMIYYAQALFYGLFTFQNICIFVATLAIVGIRGILTAVSIILLKNKCSEHRLVKLWYLPTILSGVALSAQFIATLPSLSLLLDESVGLFLFWIFISLNNMLPYTGFSLLGLWFKRYAEHNKQYRELPSLF